MNDHNLIHEIISVIMPFSFMEPQFMKQAFAGLMLLAPMTAMTGTQVVNFRMAFYADAISHTAFAGVAVGLLAGLSPYWTMPLFAVLIGIGIIAVKKRSTLSSDTVTGVFFTAIVAFGLAVISRNPNLSRDMLRFLYGDILSISGTDIYCLAILFIVLLVFQFLSYNKLLYWGLHPVLAKVHNVNAGIYQYIHAVLLAMIIIFSVWWVGVLLATGMLIIPSAAARNFVNSSAGMFWWSIVISLSSALAGFVISAQQWANTATGATVILAAFCWFAVSIIIKNIRK